LTAFIALNNRRGTRFLDGTTLAAVDAWCTTHLGRDALQFCQVFTVRFSAGSFVLRAVSRDRLLVRARIYQAAVRALRAIAAITVPVGGMALGKHLLMGERWDGELDLSDEPSSLIYLRRIGSTP
jgi:hypothetical protein